jgi:hypothetical protein
MSRILSGLQAACQASCSFWKKLAVGGLLSATVLAPRRPLFSVPYRPARQADRRCGTPEKLAGVSTRPSPERQRPRQPIARAGETEMFRRLCSLIVTVLLFNSLPLTAEALGGGHQPICANLTDILSHTLVLPSGHLAPGIRGSSEGDQPCPHRGFLMSPTPGPAAQEAVQAL